MSAPDLSQKVIGYRAWRLVEGRLGAQNQFMPSWRLGVNEASCLAHLANSDVRKRSHSAPASKCTCGLHAWHTTNTWKGKVNPADGWILGAVAAWGKIEVHYDGFRAQYVEPVAFSYHQGFTVRAFEAAQRFSRSHGYKFMPLDELEVFASNYGAVIPVKMRPKDSGLSDAIREVKGKLSLLGRGNVYRTPTSYRPSNHGFTPFTTAEIERWTRYYDWQRRNSYKR